MLSIAHSRTKGTVGTIGEDSQLLYVITLVVTGSIKVTIFRTAVKTVSGHEGKAAVFHKTYK